MSSGNKTEPTKGKTMNIDDLTLGQIKQLQSLLGNAPAQPDLQPYEIGQCYLIRSVTHYNLGRVVAVGQHEIVIEDAAWVADTGRYHEALATGVLGEVEPYPDGLQIVGRGGVVDAQRWEHGPARKVIS